jgi:hypothetical protein
LGLGISVPLPGSATDFLVPPTVGLNSCSQQGK